MISIVVFKWEPVWKGVGVKTKLHKAKNPVNYGSEHVNVLYHSIKRNTTVPFKFICITDDPSELDQNIEIITLWDKCRHLGGCLNRMFVFDKSMATLLGNRFICIDLDCVIVSNIDNILNRSEDFVINQFESKRSHNQIYNGGLFLMTAGSRQEVWDRFDFDNSPKTIADLHQTKNMVGDDQSWIQFVLGEKEATFTHIDGVYDYNFLNPKDSLPDNAKIILLPGKFDPSIEKNHISWIKNHWRV